MIDISKIKKGAQARNAINEATVVAYAEHIESGGIFPPIVIFFDSKNYWLADGWHRLLAHERIGCLEILEDVRVGGERDAKKYSLGANDAHGLPRTNADKRNAVSIALADKEWANLSTREIAALCKVSNALVSEMQRGITPEKKTAKNNTRAKQSVLAVNTSQDKPLIAKEEKNQGISHEPLQQELNEEPCYTELDAAHDQISALQDIIAVGCMDATPEEKNASADLIRELKTEIKRLTVEVKIITESRNSWQSQVAELKKQIARQSREISKLTGEKR